MVESVEGGVAEEERRGVELRIFYKRRCSSLS